MGINNNFNMFDDTFWAICEYIQNDELENKNMISICKELDIPKETFYKVISFLKNFDPKLQVVKSEGKEYFQCKKNKTELSIKFKLPEWIAFRSVLSQMKNVQSLFGQKIVSDKLIEFEKGFNNCNFSKELDSFYLQEYKMIQNEKLIIELQYSLITSVIMSVKLLDQTLLNLYSHKLVSLDGGLSLVAEDIDNKCLTCLAVNDIDQIVDSEDENYKPIYSVGEINDFVESMREVVGNLERLILKIQSPSQVNLRPSIDFSGSPFIIKNKDKSIIWSATLEVTSELYEWLISLADQVEVISPVCIKEELKDLNQKQNKIINKAS